MHLPSLVFLALLVAAGAVSAQPAVLQNQAYRVAVSTEVIEITRLDAPGLTRRIRPELSHQFSADDPGFTTVSAEASMRVAAWKRKGSPEPVRNFWEAGGMVVRSAARIVSTSPAAVELEMDEGRTGRLTLAVRLEAGMAPPALVWRLTATEAGWHSVGLTGLAGRDPQALDFLYQPLVWSWKRFPASPVLTTESFATTAAVFTNAAGATEGLAPDPSEIPYRFATFANSRFGLGLRDAAGQARPVVFAPILGGAESRMERGATHTFAVRYLLEPGDWYAGLQHFLGTIAGYRNERRNVAGSLNDTWENIIDYAMDDVYGGWVPELKGSDYRFDVPTAVKNVAASHVLSVALTTGDQEIYRRRGLPLLEFLLSRERYLYASDPAITTQNPSRYLRGPAVELGELAALHLLSGGRDSVYRREASRLFGKPRSLNLNTETGGASWQDSLALYRITRDAAHLTRAREGADRLIAQTVDTYPGDFTTNPGLRDRGAAFVTDFMPPLYDFVELYEETGERRYLDAALVSARQLLLWQRSNPMAPAGTWVANPGGRVPGVFPGRRHGTDSDFKPYDTTSLIPEQRVEAWRTSLVGTLPEQPGTYRHGPVMLAHHAPWLLRLSFHGGDPLLAAAANNAVIGRYANFPGYYFTSLETTVYQQFDYPLRPYLDVRYNAIFYNHIWPHIALLQDFLVSEAFAKSAGAVNFPSAYAPGYAFLTSKVYGHRGGRVFGNDGVRLWLPRRALRSSTVALNHVFGAAPDATYLVLSNTHASEVSAEIALDPDVLRLDSDRAYSLTVYRPGGANETATLIDGRLQVRVASEGLVAIKIHGLKNLGALPSQPTEVANTASADDPDYFRLSTNDAAGTVTGMILRFGARTDAFIFTDRTDEALRRASLVYRLDGHDGETAMDDGEYPFEFSIPLPPGATALQARLILEDRQGTVTERALPDLRVTR